MSPFSPDKILCILYSSGGTADVGRHAVQAALEATTTTARIKIRVLTKDPKTLLEESNWKCACDAHSFSTEDLERLDIRAVDVTRDDLKPHLENVGGIISALGNRQPYFGDRVGTKGTRNLIQAVEAMNMTTSSRMRLVAITSVGCTDDWPPMEFHWAGKALTAVFWLSGFVGYNDLNGAEKEIQASNSNTIDYLLVRPVGLGEERRPKGEWYVQKEKGVDKLGPDMSKMDCARFVVSEVLNPTYTRAGVVVGSNWETFQLDEPKAESSGDL